MNIQKKSRLRMPKSKGILCLAKTPLKGSFCYNKTMRTYSIRTILLGVFGALLVFGLYIPHTSAVDFSSDNFILRDPVISSGGGESTSGSFQLFSTIGQTASSQNTSTSFTQNAGFLFFPFASAPVLTPTVGDAEVALSWTASSAVLGNITDYQVGTTTTSGGPYTYESVGIVTSFTKTSLTNGTTYYFVIKAKIGFVRVATSNEASAAPVAAAPPPSGGGGGGTPVTPPPVPLGDVVLIGKAYPNALVTILRNGVVSATLKAPLDGTFSTTILGVPAGINTFSIFAEDTAGRKSISLSFTTSVISGVITTLAGIFLPPTIDTPSEINQGKILPIRGQTFPQSTLSISVQSEEIINEVFSEDGSWQYNFDTAILEEGIHLARAKAISIDGGQSIFSDVRVFTVLAPSDSLCASGNLNSSGGVNLVDFSILMFWWQRSNSCADQNSDGIVNIIDFSILLFWWTG